MPTTAQLKAQEELRALARDPNVRKMLDTISWAEGADYDTLVGGGKFDDFSRHPRKAVNINRLGVSSSAAGRYQILGKTWDGLVKQYGFSEFSPETQDLAAVALIKGRGALGSVLAGNWQKAIPKLNREWASFPGDVYGQGGKKLGPMLARLADGEAASSLPGAFEGSAGEPRAGEPGDGGFRTSAAWHQPANEFNPFLLDEMARTQPAKRTEEAPVNPFENLMTAQPQPAGNPFQLDAPEEVGLRMERGGQPGVAFPESDEEAGLFDTFKQYGESMRGHLHTLMEQLNKTESRLSKRDNPLNDYPTMFDDRLRAIIDRV